MALLVVTVILGSAGAVTASAAKPYCGITWGSLPKVHDVFSTAALVAVRTGQHDCYDRVVFDLLGPAGGYRVTYADQIYGEGRGDRLGVAGGAQLHLVLLDPAYDVATGVLTYPHRDGDHMANVTGNRTLRDVVYGGTFQGYTTFRIGVRARLPFRIFTLDDQGTGTRVVVDVAHRWSS